MRNRVLTSRSRVIRQAALVALMAGATAACSGGSERFNKPLFSGLTGTTQNQREILGDAGQPMPGPVAMAPTSDVTRADLPAPVESASLEPAPTAYSGTGRWKWSGAGGRVVTIQPGESLDTLAIRYGVPSNQIAIANGISSPAQLTPGKVIVIPVKVADFDPTAEQRPISVADAAPKKPAKAKKPGSRQIATAEVHSTNNPKAFGGTKILGTLPARSVDSADATSEGPPVATIAMAKSPDLRAPEAPAMPSIPQQRKGPSFDDATAAVDQAAEPPSTNGTSFRWPVRGRIIGSFGTKPNGEKNDGINLAVPEGTSVKAAEAGTVIYAGNELEGYGNLVLIRHADGWVTAYAHNSALKVKRGDQVRRGQTVATAGSSGSVSSPQVHFELRKGAKPVNPLDYLAGA